MGVFLDAIDHILHCEMQHTVISWDLLHRK